jgi:N-acetylmuramoyl-L-alanine amidase
MNLKTLFLTQNNCYKAGKRHTVKGIMIHSTGANNPWLKRYIGPDDGLLGNNPYNNHWNQPTPGGRSVCVHAFIGKLKDGSIATYQTLPWDMVGWHSGSGSLGSAKNANNNGYIGFEICEDNLKDPVYFNKVYQEAVELCAYLCKEYNIKPEKPWLICHSEGNKLGIASNHSDVMHWFPRHGKSMDDFRENVKRALGVSQKTPSVLYYVQTGAYSVKANADAQYHKVKAAGFDAIIKKSGNLYKVQVGAFAVKENAENMARRVKKAGFDVYITTEGGTPVAPGPEPKPTEQKPQTKTIKVGSKVKVKPGAKTYDGKGLADFVYKTVYDVIQINGNRVVIGRGKAVTAAIKAQDLILL